MAASCCGFAPPDALAAHRAACQRAAPSPPLARRTLGGGMVWWPSTALEGPSAAPFTFWGAGAFLRRPPCSDAPAAPPPEPLLLCPSRLLHRSTGQALAFLRGQARGGPAPGEAVALPAAEGRLLHARRHASAGDPPGGAPALSAASPSPSSRSSSCACSPAGLSARGGHSRCSSGDSSAAFFGRASPDSGGSPSQASSSSPRVALGRTWSLEGCATTSAPQAECASQGHSALLERRRGVRVAASMGSLQIDDAASDASTDPSPSALGNLRMLSGRHHSGCHRPARRQGATQSAFELGAGTAQARVRHRSSSSSSSSSNNNNRSKALAYAAADSILSTWTWSETPPALATAARQAQAAQPAASRPPAPLPGAAASCCGGAAVSGSSRGSASRAAAPGDSCFV